MDLGLEGKRALVMGASTGIGRGVAAALVKEGARVAICARDAGRLSQTRDDIGAALALPVDLSEAEAGRTLVEGVCDELGGLDILVTNTGGPPRGAFADITTEQWEHGFRSLWMSAVDAIRAALVPMRAQRWGRIAVITSTSGREPIPGLTVSNAFRPGLHGLVNTVSKEVAADGVTVNAIMPGFIDTERLAELGIPRDTLAAMVPAGRIASAQELGAFVAMIVSEPAGHFTGQALAFDGGRTAGI